MRDSPFFVFLNFFHPHQFLLLKRLLIKEAEYSSQIITTITTTTTTATTKITMTMTENILISSSKSSFSFSMMEKCHHHHRRSHHHQKSSSSSSSTTSSSFSRRREGKKLFSLMIGRTNVPNSMIIIARAARAAATTTTAGGDEDGAEVFKTGGEIPSSEVIKVYPLAEPRIPLKTAEGEQINGMKELTAKAIIGEVLRMSSRDFLPTVTLVFVAGFFAQALNLGGTFLLALIQVHEVEVIAATFVVATQAWKFLCQFLVRIATFKNAYVGDKEEDGTIEKVDDNSDDDKYAKVKPKYAYGVLKQGLELYKSILIIDLRRTLSIAWNGMITIPIPYLGLMRCLDLALCVPVRIFEGKQGGENLKRSTELMLGRKILLLKTFFYLSAIASSLVGLIIGLFSLLVPSLATVLLPPVGADPASLGGAAQGLVTGTAFERVWDVGTVTERSATILLLMIAVVLSFFFTLGFRQLIYVFHREVANRWIPPPPPPPRKLPEWAKKLKKKVQFWKKDDVKKSA